MNLYLLLAQAADAASAAAPEPRSLAVTLGIGIGLAIVVMLVPALAAWLKKQKIVQKYHLEGSIDKYADRLVHYLEDVQKSRGITGTEALKIGVDKVKDKFGIGDSDAEEALRAAYTKGKRVKDAVEKATANANFPTPPAGGS